MVYLHDMIEHPFYRNTEFSKHIIVFHSILYTILVLFSHFLTGVRKIFLLTSEKSVLGKWLVEIWLWRQNVLFSSEFSYCDVMKKATLPDDVAYKEHKFQKIFENEW